ncbi:MAG: NAD-dependent epimerase/dehydratase family protein, partial [Bdellovibrionota bacterium]
MKILITGASGFLGSSLARHWAGKHELFLMPGRKNFAQNLSLFEPVDWLVHAGFEVSFRPDAQAIERNLASCRAIVDFFKSGKAKALLFVSAAGVMGVSAGPNELNESAIGTTAMEFAGYRATAYIQAKLQAEAIFRSGGMPLTVVYPTTVFGAGMPSETLHAMLESKICPPGGTSFLTLTDFLSAMDLAVSRNAEGEGYILNGKNLLFRDFFRSAR